MSACVYFSMYNHISKHSAEQVHLRVSQAATDIAETADVGRFSYNWFILSYSVSFANSIRDNESSENR